MERSIEEIDREAAEHRLEAAKLDRAAASKRYGAAEYEEAAARRKLFPMQLPWLNPERATLEPEGSIGAIAGDDRPE